MDDVQLKKLLSTLEKVKEQQVFLQRHVEDAAENFDILFKEVKWLRRRLASIFPERRHCPKCKSLLHPLAKVCGQCGKQIGPKELENKGLPSE